MIGYKKVCVVTKAGKNVKADGHTVRAILELEIPDTAAIRAQICDTETKGRVKRRIGHGKHRASQVKVLRVVECGVKPLFENFKTLDFRFRRDRHRLVSTWHYTFQYDVGQIYTPEQRFAPQNDHCASGIHFYRTLKEARNH